MFKKLLSCKWYIHINLIVLVFFFNHQLYLFGVQDAHNYTTQNIQIKTNFWVETYSNPFQNFNTKSTTTPNNVYCENILQKNIFEKTIKVKTLVEECYNFNNQTLIQTYASSFICSLLTARYFSVSPLISPASPSNSNEARFIALSSRDISEKTVVFQIVPPV